MEPEKRPEHTAESDACPQWCLNRLAPTCVIHRPAFIDGDKVLDDLTAFLSETRDIPPVDGYCTCHGDERGATRDCGIAEHRAEGWRRRDIPPAEPEHRLIGSACTCGDWSAGCGHNVPEQWQLHVALARQTYVTPPERGTDGKSSTA